MRGSRDANVQLSPWFIFAIASFSEGSIAFAMTLDRTTQMIPLASDTKCCVTRMVAQLVRCVLHLRLRAKDYLELKEVVVHQN